MDINMVGKLYIHLKTLAGICSILIPDNEFWDAKVFLCITFYILY